MGLGFRVSDAPDLNHNLEPLTAFVFCPIVEGSWVRWGSMRIPCGDLSGLEKFVAIAKDSELRGSGDASKSLQPP